MEIQTCAARQANVTDPEKHRTGRPACTVNPERLSGHIVFADDGSKVSDMAAFAVTNGVGHSNGRPQDRGKSDKKPDVLKGELHWSRPVVPEWPVAIRPARTKKADASSWWQELRLMNRTPFEKRYPSYSACHFLPSPGRRIGVATPLPRAGEDGPRSWSDAGARR